MPATCQAAAEAGEPILRPTLYDFDADPAAWGASDEVMLGPSLLAAPVVEPGARQRRVRPGPRAVPLRRACGEARLQLACRLCPRSVRRASGGRALAVASVWQQGPLQAFCLLVRS